MRTFKTSVKGNKKLLGNLNFYIKMNLKLMDVGPVHILTKIYAKQFPTSENVDFITLRTVINPQNVGI